jgi:diaminohydroxyphosphoribosylaminopyrimidine deaminase/5-amino-6-(5-phosphoribosylamino)uracil reductase
MSEADDERLMRAAIGLAQRGWGRTHPNPMVGCAIVEAGEIVAGACHERDGGPHAERAALESLGRRPRAGATLYVTLEPCSTEGRTGACTRAIVEAGIKRVVAGATDPNPEHAGRGYDILRQSGVEVLSGVLEAECADLNLIYNHWTTRKEPLLAGKLAATLDGKIATRTGESRWITGAAARADVHRWRRLFPAIAVGAGTVVSDNPSLTARMPDEPEWCPIRFVFDGQLRSISAGSPPKVYSDAFAKRTIAVTTQHAGVGYVRKLRDLGVGVWVFESPSGKVPLSQFRSRCAAEGIPAVLLEGGAELLSRGLIERQLDYLLAYRSPVIFADERARSVLAGLRTEKLAQAIRLSDVRHLALGDDMLMRGKVSYPQKVQIDETLFSLG